MDFDAIEHLGNLPKNPDRYSREIVTRTTERGIISRLIEISLLTNKQSRTPKEEELMITNIRTLAMIIDHLSLFSFTRNLSSGANAEILARLIGAGILVDSPTVGEGRFDTPDVRYQLKVDNKPDPKDPLVKLHLEHTRPKQTF